MDRLVSIQFLRAIAAIAVVLFHSSGPGFGFGVGAAGVDVFFVISGVIMGTFARDAAPDTFMVNRVIRIVPLYWAVTLMMCAGAMAGVFATFSFDLDQLWRSLLFIPYETRPLVEVGWTLNLEMLFYVVFALGLWLGAPIRFTLSVLSLAVVSNLAFNWQDPAVALWTSPLLIEFMAGLVLSQLRLAGRMLGGGLVAIGAIGFALTFNLGEQSEIMRVLVWGVPATALVAGCIALERSGAWPQKLLRPMEVIGDASYALYLLHGVLISMVHKLVAPGPVAVGVILLVSLTLSVATYFVFERPATRLLKRWLAPMRYRPALGAA